MPTTPQMFATTAPPEVLRLEAATAAIRWVTENAWPGPYLPGRLSADLNAVARRRGRTIGRGGPAAPRPEYN